MRLIFFYTFRRVGVDGYFSTSLLCDSSDGDDVTVDCDDSDISVSPGADEVSDGIRAGCDSTIGEGRGGGVDGGHIHDAVDRCPLLYNPEQLDDDADDGGQLRQSTQTWTAAGVESATRDSSTRAPARAVTGGRSGCAAVSLGCRTAVFR